MQPQFGPEQSSPWMAEFHKQLVRGKHVLLYGNVLDHFYFDRTERQHENYVSVSEFLRTYFLEEGYELVGQYDIVDGLTFATQNMRPDFDRLVASAKGGAVLRLARKLLVPQCRHGRPLLDLRDRLGRQRLRRNALSLAPGIRPQQFFNPIRL